MFNFTPIQPENRAVSPKLMEMVSLRVDRIRFVQATLQAVPEREQRVAQIAMTQTHFESPNSHPIINPSNHIDLHTDFALDPAWADSLKNGQNTSANRPTSEQPLNIEYLSEVVSNEAQSSEEVQDALTA